LAQTFPRHHQPLSSLVMAASAPPTRPAKLACPHRVYGASAVSGCLVNPSRCQRGSCRRSSLAPTCRRPCTGSNGLVDSHERRPRWTLPSPPHWPWAAWPRRTGPSPAGCLTVPVAPVVALTRLDSQPACSGHQANRGAAAANLRPRHLVLPSADGRNRPGLAWLMTRSPNLPPVSRPHCPIVSVDVAGAIGLAEIAKRQSRSGRQGPTAGDGAAGLRG